MKRNAELDTLVGELFAGDAAGLTGETALECLILGGRMRRRARKRNGFLVAAAVPLFLVAGVLMLARLPESMPTGPTEAAVETVRTLPLASGQLIVTGGAVAATVNSDIGSVLVVRSGPSAAVELVSDRQLLALTSGRPAILVRPGTKDARLVFADPQDQEPDPAL
ncbi:MAG TPA: hypothetical protein VMS21_00530 [Methylomirabilota bacterium]|nr:hypothetical protein [Methylomirabilota bacterium]